MIEAILQAFLMGVVAVVGSLAFGFAIGGMIFKNGTAIDEADGSGQPAMSEQEASRLFY